MSQPPQGKPPYGPDGGRGQPPSQSGWRQSQQPGQPWGRPDASDRLTGDGHVAVVWTDHEFLPEGAVRAPRSSRAEVSALYDWWTAHSDYQA